jgi:tRNA G18 (ribose-2'-O)-methylase SpoU
MVTERYQHVMHHPDTDALLAWTADNGLTVVGIDNLPDSTPIERAELPVSSLLLFGQEGPGLSAAARGAAAMVLSISQFGSTRSINAGVASGIAMHTWIRQHALEG